MFGTSNTARSYRDTKLGAFGTAGFDVSAIGGAVPEETWIMSGANKETVLDKQVSAAITKDSNRYGVSYILTNKLPLM